MNLDVLQLRNFYSSERGRIVREILRARLNGRWPNVRGDRVLGFGYATPYLGPFTANADRVLAFMPAAQGVMVWPRSAPSATSLVMDEDWPLLDGSIDRLLLIHALETAASPAATLRECWRVLAPGGRLMVVVPNRTGLWARSDASPFGFGRPFSRGQMATLLKDTQFTATSWTEALYIWPWSGDGGRRSAPTWERLGARFFPAFGGVLIVEATKQLYQGLAAKNRATAARSRPVFISVPNALTGKE